MFGNGYCAYLFVEKQQKGADICYKDPCQNIARAVVGTCESDGNADFTCECQERYKWEDVTNSCISGKPKKTMCIHNNYIIIVTYILI